MTKRFLVLVLLFATFSNSCKKIDELADKLTHFKMVFDEPLRDVRILPLMVGETIPLTFSTATNSESQFHSNETAKNLVEEIVLEKASLVIDEAFTTDFTFLESIKFYLLADGRDDLLIASQTSISSTVGKTLDLDVIDQDLSFYLKEDEMEMKVEILATEAVLESFDIMIHMEYDVNAKVLGV